jgi:peptidoglycan/xylan/chitin deacetylase (PgdA/CDA1 family)
MLKTQAAIKRATGYLAGVWRPPYFKADERVRQALAECRLTEIGCSIAPEDYHWPAERTAAFVIERLSPGAVIDLHDGRPERSGSDQTRLATATALEQILAEMETKSLASVPVSKISCADLENHAAN